MSFVVCCCALDSHDFVIVFLQVYFKWKNFHSLKNDGFRSALSVKSPLVTSVQHDLVPVYENVADALLGRLRGGQVCMAVRFQLLSQ